MRGEIPKNIYLSAHQARAEHPCGARSAYIRCSARANPYYRRCVVAVSYLVDSIPDLAQMLQHNNSLQVLDLVSNNTCNSGATAICHAILSNPFSSLHTLYLSANNIDIEGAKAVAELLTHNKVLSSLYLFRSFLVRGGVVNCADPN